MDDTDQVVDDGPDLDLVCAADSEAVRLPERVGLPWFEALAAAAAKPVTASDEDKGA